jgi:hypothetical protein
VWMLKWSNALVQLQAHNNARVARNPEVLVSCNVR